MNLEEIKKRLHNADRQPDTGRGFINIWREDCRKLIAEVERLEAELKELSHHAMRDLEGMRTQLLIGKQEIERLEEVCGGWREAMDQVEVALNYDSCEGIGHSAAIRRILAELAAAREENERLKAWSRNNCVARRQCEANEAENKRLREALKEITGCQSVCTGDVVDIARRALKEEIK